MIDDDDGSDDAHPALWVLAERFASNATRGYSQKTWPICTSRPGGSETP
jgi:hypothetical protein